MSSTFKFHSTVGETVPFNATYAFPSQSTQIQKSVVKIPSKNGDSFTAGNIIRFELPAEGYLNVQNSVVQLDVTLSGTTPRLQRGGAHNLIKRLRVLYGSLVLEDIQDYKTLVRIFTEVGVQADYQGTSGAILEGMSCSQFLDLHPTSGTALPGGQGEYITGTSGPATGGVTAHTHDTPNIPEVLTQHELLILMGGSRRTYCLSLLSGLLTTKKLIPLKWMASQLAIEITLATNNEALISPVAGPAFTVSQPNFIAEMVEFDTSYDKAFYMGLQQGIPIKFSSWHTHQFAFTGNQQTFQIHERSRSVKAAFAVAKSSLATTAFNDSDYFYHALGMVNDATSGFIATSTTAPIDEFQWRVGGRYYPSQPVRSTYGGSEAYVELMKTVNYLGNHTVASKISPTDWTSYYNGTTVFSGKNVQCGGTKFIMACEFENTDAMPDTIAGINAEEQSDIALSIRAAASPSSKDLLVFIHYDAMLIVKTGNMVELVM